LTRGFATGRRDEHSRPRAVTRELCDEMAVLYAGEIVELGPSERIVSAPTHPYTQMLIRSVPTLTVPDEEPAAPAARA
jgi:ABC-type dipeptide/oligopeptide/nickel transport system ATPase component